MKVGILTFHRALNYGAFLQAVCLCSRLNQEKDISAEIIDFDMRSAQQAYKQLFQNNVKRQVKRLLYTLQKKEFVVPLNTTEAFQRGQVKIKI